MAFFQNWVIPVGEKLVLRWLPGQESGALGSVQGRVDLGHCIVSGVPSCSSCPFMV